MRERTFDRSARERSMENLSPDPVSWLGLVDRLLGSWATTLRAAVLLLVLVATLTVPTLVAAAWTASGSNWELISVVTLPLIVGATVLGVGITARNYARRLKGELHRQASAQEALNLQFQSLVPAVDVEALEEADDIRAARASLADPDQDISLDDVLAKYADDLAAYPDER